MNTTKYCIHYTHFGNNLIILYVFEIQSWNEEWKRENIV